MKHYAIAGTPGRCVKGVMRFADVGISEVVLGPRCDPAAVPGKLARLAGLFRKRPA